MLTLNDIILRLALSIILCGILGLERQIHKRPLGFRTNALVGLGTTLITVVAINILADYPELAMSPAFLFLAIGFIGSGTIIKSGESVVGLTTAATLWVTAAIGVTIGFGLYTEAVITTILALIILLVFKKIDEWVEKK